MNRWANKTVLVTGANRGIGKAIVSALVQQPVSRVYACARNPASIECTDPKVIPLELDITNPAQVSAAAQSAADVDIVINNAGTNLSGNLLSASIDEATHDFNINFIGTLRMIQAFTPVFETRGGGTFVNVISICGLGGMPSLGGYCVSKAALYSASQSLRTELAPKNISLFSVYPGPVDTDMNEGVDIDKASPESLAHNLLVGIENQQEDIFPDPVAEDVYRMWSEHPKVLEEHFKQF